MEEVRRIDEEWKEVCNQETEVENDVTQFLLSDPWLSWGEERKNPVCNERGVSKIACTTTEAKSAYSESRKGVSIYSSDAHHKCWGCRPSQFKKSLDTIVNEVKKEIQAYCVSERKPLKINFVKCSRVFVHSHQGKRNGLFTITKWHHCRSVPCRRKWNQGGDCLASRRIYFDREEFWRRSVLQ